MENIPAVANNKANVITAEFVKLIIYNEYNPTLANAIVANVQYQIVDSGNTAWTTIGATSNVAGTIFIANATGTGNGIASNCNLYTFSSSYKSETIDGIEYTPLGGLLAVGSQNRNLRVTNGDTTISISGISGNNIQQVLASNGKIRGSSIEVKRGFYNDNYVLSNSATRFTGIVTSYTIQEEREDADDNFTISLDASSFKTVLDNRIAGRKTNKESWNYFNSADSSMNNVNSIAGFRFDFGRRIETEVQPGYVSGGIAGDTLNDK